MLARPGIFNDASPVPPTYMGCVTLGTTQPSCGACLSSVCQRVKVDSRPPKGPKWLTTLPHVPLPGSSDPSPQEKGPGWQTSRALEISLSRILDSSQRPYSAATHASPHRCLPTKIEATWSEDKEIYAHEKHGEGWVKQEGVWAEWREQVWWGPVGRPGTGQPHAGGARSLGALPTDLFLGLRENVLGPGYGVRLSSIQPLPVRPHLSPGNASPPH